MPEAFPTRGLRKSGMRSPPLAVRIRSEHHPSVLERPAAIFGKPDAISRVGGVSDERPERRDP
jgi:hypothetical protein